MAYVGLPYYGYCTYTETDNGDGTVTENLGTGKLTRSVIKFAPSAESSAVELWAGDLKEQDEYDNPGGTISIDRSYISLEEEAAMGGHKFTQEGAEGGMVHNADDTPALLRVAAMAKLKKPDRKVAYRVVGYYRATMAPIADEMSTRSAQKAFGQQNMTGTLGTNAKGDFSYKNEYPNFETALADMKKFLNIT